jgi:antitoxin ParD1/3/4
LTIVVTQTIIDMMGKNTLSFAIPESLTEYIDRRVATGGYGNRSEYIRDLVRQDQREQAKARLRALIEEGLASGPPTVLTQADRDELRGIASGKIR